MIAIDLTAALGMVTMMLVAICVGELLSHRPL